MDILKSVVFLRPTFSMHKKKSEDFENPNFNDIYYSLKHFQYFQVPRCAGRAGARCTSGQYFVTAGHNTTQSQTRLKQTTKMFQIKASCSPLNIKLKIFVVKYFQLCANCQHSAEVGPVGITPPPTTLSLVSRCHYFRFHYLCTSPEMSCAENISYC